MLFMLLGRPRRRSSDDVSAPFRAYSPRAEESCTGARRTETCVAPRHRCVITWFVLFFPDEQRGGQWGAARLEFLFSFLCVKFSSFSGLATNMLNVGNNNNNKRFDIFSPCLGMLRRFRCIQTQCFPRHFPVWINVQACIFVLSSLYVLPCPIRPPPWMISSITVTVPVDSIEWLFIRYVRSHQPFFSVQGLAGANPAVNTPRPSRGTRIESCDLLS